VKLSNLEVTSAAFN